MVKAKKLIVKGISISTIQVGDDAYISITDIARNKNAEEPKDVVKNWMRSRTTIEFPGIWEQLYKPLFKGVEFDSFLFAAGSNSFTLSPAVLLNQCILKHERLIQLNSIAITQMKSLLGNENLKGLQ